MPLPPRLYRVGRPARWAVAGVLALALTHPTAPLPAQSASATVAAHTPAAPAGTAPKPPATLSIAAAEAAVAAIAAGQFPAAYVALEPLNTTHPTSLLGWSAQLARTRILNQLGARLAAQAALPPPPAKAWQSAAPWAQAAWLLTSADLARATGKSQAALADAQQAYQLLARLMAPNRSVR